MDRENWGYEKELMNMKETSQLRILKVWTDRKREAGETWLNLSSNDYLGLKGNEKLQNAFRVMLDCHREWLVGGSCSSRLLTGNSRLYEQLEAAIADWYGMESVLFFNSGYHANMGILPALTTKKDLIVSDKLCHASLLDGIGMSAATHLRFRHNDYDHLERILRKQRGNYKRLFIVTESIFSMDGDKADLKQLVRLKERYEGLLYLDEAHAVGAVGSLGRGVADEQGVLREVDILVAPMGKAMASLGAFVLLGETLCQLLVNKARTLIFTTALPAFNLAWSLFVVQQMPALEESRKRLELLTKVTQDCLKLKRSGYIIPIVVGENKIAVQLAEHMQRKGVLVFPIRPPTVPDGTARLRLSLTADLEQERLRVALCEMRDFMEKKNLVVDRHISFIKKERKNGSDL